MSDEPRRELADWLLEQVVKDERAALPGFALESINHLKGYTRQHYTRWQPGRVARDCEAKRRLIHLHRGAHFCVPAEGPGLWQEWTEEPACPTLRLVSVAYDHCVGYKQEWRP